jgi:hypothetical protein
MSAGLVAARSKLAVYQGVPRPPRTLSSMLLLLLSHQCMHPHSHNRSLHTHHDIISMSLAHELGT